MTDAKNAKNYCETRIAPYTCSAKLQFRSRELENFSSVRKVADHLFDFEYGSRVSLDDCLFNLSVFCNFLRMSPDEVILLDKESLAKGINAMCKYLANKDLSLKYIRTIVYSIKTLLKCNGVVLELNLPKMPPRYKKRQHYVPTPQEVKKMIDFAGSLRNSAIIGFLGLAGLRNSTLRALQLGVCPDPNFQGYSIRHQLSQNKAVLAVVVHPEMKRKVVRACKGKIPYFTFVPEFVTEKLKAYLNSEYKGSTVVEDNAFLFPSTDRKFVMERRPFIPLSGTRIREIVWLGAKNAGLPQWKLVTPQCLRVSFKMWLINQPGGVRLPVEDREFLMGHILRGNMDEYYDKTRIEELREKFSKLFISEADCTKTCPKQAIVPMTSVPKLLEEGWRWITKYNDDNAILEKAS